MTIDELTGRLRQNTAQLLAVAEKIPEPRPLYHVNHGWNGIQILEHLLLTDRLVEEILFKPPHGIAPQQFLVGEEQIRQLLIDDRSPVESPPKVRPSGMIITRPHFIGEYTRMRNAFEKKLKAPSVWDSNRYYPNRFLGDMTCSDWILFVIYHTGRHIRQIEELPLH